LAKDIDRPAPAGDVEPRPVPPGERG
jgi:hypothetical protein